MPILSVMKVSEINTVVRFGLVGYIYRGGHCNTYAPPGPDIHGKSQRSQAAVRFVLHLIKIRGMKVLIALATEDCHLSFGGFLIAPACLLT